MSLLPGTELKRIRAEAASGFFNVYSLRLFSPSQGHLHTGNSWCGLKNYATLIIKIGFKAKTRLLHTGSTRTINAKNRSLVSRKGADPVNREEFPLPPYLPGRLPFTGYVPELPVFEHLSPDPAIDAAAQVFYELPVDVF